MNTQHRSFMPSLILAAVGLMAGMSCNAQVPATIVDPLADYLKMHVPARKELMSEYEVITRAIADIDGDGKDDVFIGSTYPYSGSKGTFWSAYQKGSEGYIRISPLQSDVQLVLRNAYVGLVASEGKQGILIADGRIKSNERLTVGFQDVSFWTISDGQLQQKKLSPLSLSKPDDRQLYERYFGEGVSSRPITFEDLPIDRVRQQGYEVPMLHGEGEAPVAPNESSAPQQQRDANTPSKLQPSATGQSSLSNKVSPTKPSSTASEDPASSTPWSIIVVLIVAAIGLLWLLLKRRS